jgi:hypothetical protein
MPGWNPSFNQDRLPALLSLPQKAQAAWVPAAWCPPHPAAPIFSSGLIGCQDLPNVSSHVSIFKRAPRAMFKREAGAPC